jgi:hypothetical protein
MKFNRHIDIGSLEAEDDRFLIKSFIEKDEFRAISSLASQKCIVLGRTGSGKSALLRRLEETQQNLVRIKPEEMSLRFLSNSDIIEYFRRLDIKLDLFYKVLWKHVFIVEILKLHYGKEKVVRENKIQSFFEGIEFRFNKKKKNAIEYLRKWHDKFWESTEYRVRELENRLRDEYKSSAGIDSQLFDNFVKAKISSEANNIIEQSKKVEVLNKAQKVISEIQLDEISSILDFIKVDLLQKTDKIYYIVIDDLDKEWVDSKIVYDLIVALIHTIKEINAFPNIKIIISLRLNLYQLCLEKSSLKGTQREKLANMLMHISWSEKDLTDLLQRRLEALAISMGEAPLRLEDILPTGDKRGNKIAGVEYIIKRTLFRPRDVISYFNKAIKYSDGQSKISRTALRMAESEYSVERLLAVEDEWKENFSLIKDYLKILTNKLFRFSLSDITANDIRDFCYSVYPKSSDTQLKQLVFKGWEPGRIEKVREHLINRLYQVGIVGVKPSATEKIYYSYQIDNAFDQFKLDEHYAFFVNPAFHSALHIRINVHEN